VKKILLIGAGRSSVSLINYLLQNAASHDWQIKVGDISLELAQEKVHGNERASAFIFDVKNQEQRAKEISESDIVISMLPAFMHALLAKDCLKYKKHLVTASYVNEDMQALDKEVREAGILFLNEIGLDPGLDHLSAMQILDEIRVEGGKMMGFESFCGGLVAPENDNNPWNYKFTWNPRNVVLAGQGGAVKFIQEGQYKYIPYQKLFRRTEIIEIEGYGRFEGYANRDSLKYRSIYGLDDIRTIFRGTLRRVGFCRAWDVFVQLGATDDSYIMEGSENMTHRQFMNSFLAYNLHDSVEIKLMQYLHIDQDSELMDKLKWLGIFDNTKVGLKNATPAQILQSILEKKWSLDEGDKDMIVMWHKFDYELNGKHGHRETSLVVLGDDAHHTAMAKTVGLPLGIATRLILEGKINMKGVIIPIHKEIYEPVLNELKQYGVDFIEKKTV